MVVNTMVHGAEKPWLEHYDQEVPQALLYPELSLNDLVEQTVRQDPQRVALVFMGKRLSYAELWGYVEKLAAALQ